MQDMTMEWSIIHARLYHGIKPHSSKILPLTEESFIQYITND